MHPAALNEQDLLAHCEVLAGRASGPGGQHRNKVETAIRIKHLPTGITATATERRQREQNRKQAVFRLRVKLAIQVREAVDRDAPPSACWSSRVKNNRLQINHSHEDFPALLAEAMDRIQTHNHDVAVAGKVLAVSTSQMIKLLKHEPAAMQLVNQHRVAENLRPLH